MSTALDTATRHALEHQGRRMHHALHEECPPNRKEAELIQRRVDDILDRRPRPIAVAPDGEVLYDNASPWILEQGLTTIVNHTGEPEPVFTPEQWKMPGEDGGMGGGVGLMDRPPS